MANMLPLTYSFYLLYELPCFICVLHRGTVVNTDNAEIMIEFFSNNFFLTSVIQEKKENKMQLGATQSFNIYSAQRQAS